MVAEIHKELEILQQKHDADGVLAKLTLQLRPHKALVVKEKVSKLVLVPCTWKIVQRSSSQGDLANAVKVETAWNMDDRQFWLSLLCLPAQSRRRCQLGEVLCLGLFPCEWLRRTGVHQHGDVLVRQ